MSCTPIRTGTSQPILCAEHCYEGSVDDRIKRLEFENASLRKRIVDQQERLYHYSNVQWWLNRGDTKQAISSQNGYLQSKVDRQRAMLMRLQDSRNRKWIPELIIHELEEPGDIVIQEVA
jgi:hypothetical protein